MAEVIAQLEKQLESERKELVYARLKIQVLEEQLRQQRIAQYGPGSPATCHIGQQATCIASWPPDLAGALAARGKGGCLCGLAVCLHLLRR